jgi:hypothetical protein
MKSPNIMREFDFDAAKTSQVVTAFGDIIEDLVYDDQERLFTGIVNGYRYYWNADGTNDEYDHETDLMLLDVPKNS